MKESKRPALTKELNGCDFVKYYWLKEELMAFCRGYGLSTLGSKEELTRRVERFLTTGEIEHLASQRRKNSRSKLQKINITRDTLLTTTYRNTEANRAFFKSIIGPSFHFTTCFMRFCRENPDKTYGDAVEEWYRERQEKKAGLRRTEIAPQFEYNRFIRAYFQDPAHRGHELSQAIEAWRKHRSKPRTKALEVHEVVSDLVAKLSCAEESQRIQAAVALGSSSDPQAVKPLIQALTDTRMEVRLEASKALGRLGSSAVDQLINELGRLPGDREKFPPSTAFWEKRYYVHDPAARTLVRIGKASVLALVQRLKEADDSTRGYIADALGRIGSEQATAALLTALWEASTSKTQWKIIRALGEIGDARAVLMLFRWLQSPYPYLRWEAADALGKIGDGKAVYPLMDLLKDHHPEVRRTAARALGRIGDVRAVEPLVFIAEKSLGGSPRKDARWEAVKALGRIGGDKAESALEKLKESERVDLREMAIEALEELHRKKAKRATER